MIVHVCGRIMSYEVTSMCHNDMKHSKKHRRRSLRCAIPWLLVVCAWTMLAAVPAGNLCAQSKNYDDFGKEFYVAFGPNEGGEGDQPTLNVMDLYITSRAVTKG